VDTEQHSDPEFPTSGLPTIRTKAADQSGNSIPLPFVAPLFATVQDYVGTSHIATTWQVGICEHSAPAPSCLPKLTLAEKR
jgi:hypothetical protein